MAATKTTITVVALVGSGAFADTLYDNGPVFSSSWSAGFNVTENNSGSNLADSFVLSTGGMINEIKWAGLYRNDSANSVDSFRLDIFSDVGGVPGVLVSSTSVTGAEANRAETGQTLGNNLSLFTFSAAVSFDASAGRTYWLSVVDTRQVPPFNSDRFFWAFESGPGLTATRVLGEPWELTENTNGEFAFRLNGVIPTPASSAVLAAAGLLATRRRREFGHPISRPKQRPRLHRPGLFFCIERVRERVGSTSAVRQSPRGSRRQPPRAPFRAHSEEGLILQPSARVTGSRR